MSQGSQKNNSFCFCTVAFGKNYIHLSKLLADDLHKFALGRNFIIFTDNPLEFKDKSNVQAIKHWCRGVLPYNERRFAIYYSLSIFNSVIYLDADVRIFSPLTVELDFYPGLTARSCGSMEKHLKTQFDRPLFSASKAKKKAVIDKMAEQVGVDLYSQQVKFINEFLFVVTAYEGRELDFLKLWGELAIYAGILGMHKHPTYAMALAAFKTGFPIYYSEMNGLDFFDDRIEKVKISKGQSVPEARQKYFAQQYNIEKKSQTILERLIKRIFSWLSLKYNFIRVRLIYYLNSSILKDYPSS